MSVVGIYYLGFFEIHMYKYNVRLNDTAFYIQIDETHPII
jgi:hypothetical protein